jgi:hypothetical protein
MLSIRSGATYTHPYTHTHTHAHTDADMCTIMSYSNHRPLLVRRLLLQQPESWPLQHQATMKVAATRAMMGTLLKMMLQRPPRRRRLPQPLPQPPARAALGLGVVHDRQLLGPLESASLKTSVMNHQCHRGLHRYRCGATSSALDAPFSFCDHSYAGQCMLNAGRLQMEHSIYAGLYGGAGEQRVHFKSYYSTIIICIIVELFLYCRVLTRTFCGRELRRSSPKLFSRFVHILLKNTELHDRSCARRSRLLLQLLFYERRHLQLTCARARAPL